MNRIEWIFELLDRASTPARRISNSLAGISRVARATSASSHKAHRALQSDALASARNVGQIADSIARLGAQRGFAALEAGAAASAGAIRQLGGAMASLRNLIIGGIAIGGAGLAAKSLIDQVGYIEQQRIAMSTLLKSPIKGEAAIEWAAKFADITPFEISDVLQATRLSLAMGFGTDQIERLLTTLGDAAAGTGSRIEDLVRIFGQMRAAGKLTTQDINQLAERGIGAWDYLARGLGRSTAEIRKLVEQGAIDSATGIRLLFEGMQRDFGGLMKVQSRSIFGLTSTLRSRPMTIALDLEKKGALEPFKRLLSNLVALSDFSRPPGAQIAKQLESGLSTAFKAAFGPLAAATEPDAILANLSRFANGAARIGRVWPAMQAAIGEFWAGIKSGFGMLASALRPAMAALEWLAGGMANARTEAGNISGFARLLGILAALSLAWRALNIVSLGGLGLLSRLTLLAGRAIVVRLWLSGLPYIAAGIQWLGALGAAALAAGARMAAAWAIGIGLPYIAAGIQWLGALGAAALAAGARMAAAWAIGMGPIGWAIAGIGAVGAALWGLYARSIRFRDAANSIWAGLVKGAKSAWSSIIALFMGLPERIIQAVASAGGAFVGALRNIIASAPGGGLLIKGLDAAGAAVRGAAQFGTNVGNTIVGAAKNALGVRSPSREFAYLGRMSALGLAAGLMAYAPIAERASWAIAQAAIPQPEQPAYVLPQARHQSRSITINLGDINVHAASNDASQIADAVREAALEAVLSALERAAMEEGA